MPKPKEPNEHFNLARKNLAFAKELLNNATVMSKEKYLWIITICFYAVVHSFSGFLIIKSITPPQHHTASSGGKKGNNEYVADLLKGRDSYLAEIYIKLHGLSVNCRYIPNSQDKNHTIAEEWLGKAEKFCDGIDSLV